MKSSVEVCINQDNNLIIKIDEIDYLFAETDYLTSDRGKILLKHQAIMDLAKRADVTVEEPKLLSSHSPVVYVFSRKAVRKGKETFTAIGECNNKTLFDDIMLQNPASTADNRAVEKSCVKDFSFIIYRINSTLFKLPAFGRSFAFICLQNLNCTVF